MKKMLISVISIFISFTLIIPGYAQDRNIKMQIYKKAALSRSQIARDYKEGVKYNHIITKYFINLERKKNKKALENLKSILKVEIIKLNAKNNLSIKEKKKLNLYNHLYYRTIILLDYKL